MGESPVSRSNAAVRQAQPQLRSSGGSSVWRRSREFEGAIPCLVTPDQARGDEESKNSLPLPNRVTPPSGKPLSARGPLIRRTRKRVVAGNSASGRVDVVGRLFIKKNKKQLK